MSSRNDRSDGVLELISTLIVIVTLLLMMIWRGGETSLPPVMRDLSAPGGTPSTSASAPSSTAR